MGLYLLNWFVSGAISHVILVTTNTIVLLAMPLITDIILVINVFLCQVTIKIIKLLLLNVLTAAFSAIPPLIVSNALTNMSSIMLFTSILQNFYVNLAHMTVTLAMELIDVLLVMPLISGSSIEIPSGVNQCRVTLMLELLWLQNAE